MLQNYILLAYRNLKKQKTYTCINLLGMTVGMACCFLMLTYVVHERNYDSVYKDSEQLCRIVYKANFGGEPRNISKIPAPIAPRLPDACAGIESTARFYPRNVSIKDIENGQQFEIEGVFFADSNALQVLGLDLLRGNPKTALQMPFSCILTESCAEHIFGTRNPIGQRLSFANQNIFTVTGIIGDMPTQSHMAFNMLVPFLNIGDAERASAREIVNWVIENNWSATYNFAYARLHPSATVTEVNAQMAAFIQEHGDERLRDKQAFFVEPVQSIHLQSEAGGTGKATGNLLYLKLFSIVGFLILLIACINFVNLSTAIYMARIKEIGVRKVLGAGRMSLIVQFLGETFLVALLAFGLAFGLFYVLLPHFSALVGVEISYAVLSTGVLPMLFLGVFVFAVLLAGLYPAFFASKFQAVDIFQDRSLGGKTGRSAWLRKSLITVQFAVATLLAISTLVISEQVQMWQDAPLGFDSKQIITVPLLSPGLNTALYPGDSTLRGRMNAFEEKLAKNPNILASTLASQMPGQRAVKRPVTTETITREDNLVMQSFSVDYDFSETFDLQLLTGRDFDKSFGTDHLDAFMINETALKAFGWESAEEALAKAMTYSNREGHVVGVIQDFHTYTLHDVMEPFVMEVAPGTFTAFAIKLNTKDLPKTISYIEGIWTQFFPEKSFEYTFHDETLAEAYTGEQNLAKLIGNFSAVAIFLACFGLFGILSFTIQQRSKEIGIRKVLGASVSSIVALLSLDFLKIVLLAFLLAAPLAYYYMEAWLSDFAFRIDMPYWVFAATAVLAVLFAFMTISMQAVRVAVRKPVDRLRED